MLFPLAKDANVHKENTDIFALLETQCKFPGRVTFVAKKDDTLELEDLAELPALLKELGESGHCQTFFGTRFATALTLLASFAGMTILPTGRV